MAKSAKRQFGDLGEDIACKYLEKKGFRIVARNYLKKWGEIDVVAENGSILSFVEVKTVSCEPLLKDGSRVTPPEAASGIRPEENVHPKKLERLYRTIQSYLLEQRIPVERPWRIDVACVYIDISARKARVDLIENVVL